MKGNGGIFCNYENVTKNDFVTCQLYQNILFVSKIEEKAIQFENRRIFNQ